MEPIQWRPSSTIETLQDRANLLQRIREFFASKGVLEVETPLIGSYSSTALHIDPIMVIEDSSTNLTTMVRFLQTSPEYAMKRLLSAGSGDIFQICKAFRAKELGRLHNPEFTMLEWYRLGFDHHQLMQEVIELLQYIIEDPDNSYTINKISYREIFKQYVGYDPISASLAELQQLVIEKIGLSDKLIEEILKNSSKQDCQELLFTHKVEPAIGKDYQIWCIYDYPEEQAALSQVVIDDCGDRVGQRFEVYINSIELANGYRELADSKIQEQRFLQDQKQRTRLNKQNLAIDPYFLSALEFGLPKCSGVALGVDRLLLIKNRATAISEILSFPYDRI